MSKEELGRRTEIQVSIGGVDITKDLKPYFLSMTYTDNEGEEADDLRIELQDREGLWTERWIAQMMEAAARAGSSAGTGAVGDIVSFTGSRHYVASTSDAGYPTRPGQGRITAVNPGSRHPYHLIHVDDTTNLYGWVDAKDISLSGAVAGEETGAGEYRVVPDEGLNVRDGPGTGYEKLGALKQGEKVTALSVEEGWARIDYGGKTGYVSAQYLNRAGSEVPALHIEAAIIRRNWNSDGTDQVLNCGIFELDAVDSDGPPDTVIIKATALPYGSAIRQTEKSRGWENCTLSWIAGEMARDGGMSCMYLSKQDPHYERVEQYRMSDVAFLRKLCQQAGIALKASGLMLILYDEAEYESKEPVRTIERGVRGGYIDRHLSVGKAETQYQSCRVSYNDPQTGQSIQAVVKAENWTDREDNQQLEITAKVTSIGQAQELAEKYLRLQNKYSRTAEFTMPGDTELIAGGTVRLAGWGYWNGLYAIHQASHQVDKGGYTTAVMLRRSKAEGETDE